MTLDEDKQMLIVNAACHAIAINQEGQRMALSEQERPSFLYRPRLFIDGNQWCALYGENIQDGVAGFGYSPKEAMLDFDIEWGKPINQPTQ